MVRFDFNEPADHKNRWRGHRRIVALGPKAQEVIKCFLQLATQAYLFSPQVAEARRNDQRRQERKTPMTPSHGRARAWRIISKRGRST